MARKPDILRTVLLIFAIGLVITGFTSLHASEDNRTAPASTFEMSQPAD